MAQIAATVEVHESSTLVPDLGSASVHSYGPPYGTRGEIETQVFVPLVETGAEPPYVGGAIFIRSLHEQDSLAWAFVAGRDPQDWHFMLYGTSPQAVKVSFSGEHQNIAETIVMLGQDSKVASVPGGSVGRGPPVESLLQDDLDWEDILEWLSSDSPAEDLPWWLDVIAGAAWADAAIGTHNPASISLCIHFIGLYAVACFYDAPGA